MTMGQRIAQKRKEQNLSQEALGETLGVSRQSISKWESDSSLPEIEKLVALSKLFGVSVGWLLGVEEERPEENGGSDELTEEPMKLVEEIVGRYIAAQPKPMSRRGKRAIKGAVVVAALCFTMGLFWLAGQMEQLENQYSSLQNSVGMISSSVDSQINSIGSRVEEILQAQNNLTADYSVQWADMDLAAGTVTIAASAVPKTYREGMTAQFLAECQGEVLTFPAELTAGQTFSAEFDCPLVNSILVSVVFLDGETRETQLLQEFSNLYDDTVPPAWLDDTWCFDEATWEGGVMTQPETILFVHKEWENHGGQDLYPDVTQLKVGLFKNQELVVWGKEIPKPSSYQGSGWEKDIFYQFPEAAVSCEVGDILCYAMVVTDEYGRTAVRGGEEYVVTGASGEDGEQMAPEVNEDGDSPSVRVPGALETTGQINCYRYDDPADWGLTGY